MWTLLFATVSVVTLYCSSADASLSQRVAVIRSKTQFVGFINEGGKLLVSTSTDSTEWRRWVPLNTSGSSPPLLVSNPVGLIDGYSGVVVVYAQGSDGQIYTFSENSDSTFKVTKLTTDIPFTKTAPDQCSIDGVKVINVHNLTHLFVRAQTNRSRIYYGYQEWTKGAWSKFVPIADDKNHLKYDFDVVKNTFVRRIEVFAVVGDEKVKHTWQTSYTSFGDSWHEVMLIDSPKFNSAPAAHTMGNSDFNGMIEVFVREGNTLHHIHQMTCDKVKNPWGPCTWEVSWHELGGDLPSDPDIPNPLTVSNNIHLGQEIFVVGVKDGHLYHIWQPERGKSWSDWEDLGTFPSGERFMSQPYIVIDQHGWWEAYGTTSSGLHKYVQANLVFTATPQRQVFGQNVTVAWQVPTDQATSKDWIGVYPKNGENHKYIDFKYVGGTQNPKSDPVPKGSLQLLALLPNGFYDYRYLVNKEFDNVTSVSVEVYNATTEQEWVQLYRGIGRGLGNLATNLTACVKDGDTTIEKFKESFKAFEDKQIINGLHLFAEALKDVTATLVQCQETDIAEKVEKFIEDLISCTESKCDKFVIDAAREIIIIYERFYEIYGDILAAKNNFEIEAYEMGGYCIGRVTWSCLAAPDNKN